MLFTTSLVALVGAGEQPELSPRRLRLYDTKKQSLIQELNFVTTILRVLINKKRLVVVLDAKLHIFDLNKAQLLHVMDTIPNPKGLCVLTANDVSLMAFPCCSQSGEVMIHDSLNMQSLGVIKAHETSISCLAFNYDGTMLATASGKGTVIRVWTIPNVEKAFQFRRGSQPRSIHSLSFNISSTMLCVSSDTGSIHIFKVEEPLAATPAQYLSSTVVSYLPEFVGNMWEPSRAFAMVHLSASAGVPNICCISSSNSEVMIITANGELLVYQLDAINGGDCKIVEEHRLGF